MSPPSGLIACASDLLGMGQHVDGRVTERSSDVSGVLTMEALTVRTGSLTGLDGCPHPMPYNAPLYHWTLGSKKDDQFSFVPQYQGRNSIKKLNQERKHYSTELKTSIRDPDSIKCVDNFNLAPGTRVRRSPRRKGYVLPFIQSVVPENMNLKKKNVEYFV